MTKSRTMINIQYLGFVLLLFNLWAVSVSSLSEEGFLQCLLASDNSTEISKVIYTPQNQFYQSTLDARVQNLRFLSEDTPKPELIITPVRESQIQRAIHCSRKHGLQMRIRSGGHDFDGISYISEVPFFILDMFNFKSISIDLQRKTAWVGAGATLGEIYYTIYQKNKSLTIPAGAWPTCGAGGHISGGGYGPLVRKFGLAADNVIDARIIDVNGKVLTKKSMGEDLFWAIRGGDGASFGVILGYKLKLVEVPENVTAFKVTRTLEQNATKLVLKWQEIAPKVPLELVISLHVGTISSNETATGRTVEATFDCVFLGGVDELLILMEEYFPELGLRKEDCQELEWIQYYAFLLDYPLDEIESFLTNRDYPAKSYSKAKSDFVQKPFPEEGFEKIWDLFLEVDDPGAAQMHWYAFGGIMDTISESKIPFPHRAGTSFIVFEGVYWNGTYTEASIQELLTWLEKFHNLIGNYVAKDPRGAYVDYRDLDLGTNNKDGETSIEQARKWGASYFKNNFDRLVRVKTSYDPSNFFRTQQSIPPSTILLGKSSEEVKIM